MNAGSLQNLIEHSFGFDSFRPLQREIMVDSLAWQDELPAKCVLPFGAGDTGKYAGERGTHDE